MTEQTVMQWFAGHPFTRNELLLVLGAVSGIAKADWDTFKAHQLGHADASFSWRVAAWKYWQAIVIGGLPPLAAELWKILGA